MKRNVWVKATRSGNNGQCVEVRDRTSAVDVRDSKNPAGPVLTFSPGSWGAFVRETKHGELDKL